MTVQATIEPSASKLKIFRNGSRTFFYSSLFFPARVRDDVFTLYGFTRVVDDLVDSVPQQPEAFVAMRDDYARAMQGQKIENEIVTSFVDMAKRHQFDEAWMEAFFRSMASDLGEVQYQTIVALRQYIYGAAEVIGLMSQRLMGVPKETEITAQVLGRAFQYINFIRDIQEDLDLKRQYLPIEELEAVGLKDLSEPTAREKPDAFLRFMQQQFERYRGWQRDAQQGLRHVPARVRVPLLTAAQMYWWTAEQIERDPWVVYRKKVKPSVGRVVAAAPRNALRARFGRTPRIAD